MVRVEDLLGRATDKKRMRKFLSVGSPPGALRKIGRVCFPHITAGGASHRSRPSNSEALTSLFTSTELEGINSTVCWANERGAFRTPVQGTCTR